MSNTNSDIMVSIVCLAYNHEKYIRSALDGFLMQKTNFNYEIIVHDDASTDRTADIIREYESKYRNIIKPIYQTVNQYSKGVKIIEDYLYPKVTGKYIAFCEGDDYWTDEYKLQKQVDLLEKYDDIDICAHQVSCEKDGKFVNLLTKEKEFAIFSPEQVILRGGAFVGTTSLMYRADLCKNLPEFIKVKNMDYSIQIHGSLRGGMIYMPDNMAVYRLQTESSWTVATSKNLNYLIANIHEIMNMLKQLDEDTQQAYHSVIEHVINTYQTLLFLYQKEYEMLKVSPYKEIIKEYRFIEKVKIVIKYLLHKCGLY